LQNIWQLSVLFIFEAKKMRKIKVFIYCLVFVCAKTYAKNVTSADSLKKYSYLIKVGDKKGKMGSATCFFYKVNNKTYVISSYHVFCFGAIKTSSYYTNNIYISFNQKTDVAFVVKLDSVYEFTSIEHIHIPDVFGCAINPPKGAKINYINDLFDIKYIGKKPSTAYSYGYPTNNLELLKGEPSLDFNPLLDYLRSQWKISYPTLTNDELYKNVVYYHEVLNRNYFVIEKESYAGFSGAPVFGEFMEMHNNKEIKFYKFIGITSGGKAVVKRTRCLKGKRVKEYLDKNCR
jgi:hypothetical protein